MRRDVIHGAVVDALSSHLLDPTAIDRARREHEEDLRLLLREEEAAASAAGRTKGMRALDEKESQLRAIGLPDSALKPALAALEAEREELRARATGSIPPRISRAREALAVFRK